MRRAVPFPLHGLPGQTKRGAGAGTTCAASDPEATAHTMPMANLRRSGTASYAPPPAPPLSVRERSLSVSDGTTAHSVSPASLLPASRDRVEAGAKAGEVYLTHSEAAGYLRISVRMLHYLVQRREVTPGYVGRRRRYAVGMLDAYVRASARVAPRRA